MKHFLFVSLLSLFTLSAAQNLPGQLQSIGTDATKANIPLEDILSGGPPPNGIPALGFVTDWQGAAESTQAPAFISQDEAAEWLGESEPVIAFRVGDEAKAYPLQILTWHEIVNDYVGGVPVAVTFCPLCNSALAFDRRIPVSEAELSEVNGLNTAISASDLDQGFLDTYAAQGGDAALAGGIEVSFGVSGALYNSNMLMFDNATSTLWSQLLGVGSVGALTDTRLLRYPAQIVSFAEFRSAYPDAPVLSKDTGFSRDYGTNPYVGYDDVDSPAFLFQGETDGRLPPKARVISVETPTEDVAYPFEILSEAEVINDTIGDLPVTLFWQEGTASALDSARISEGEDIGAVGIFSRELKGEVLEFTRMDSGITDKQTLSTWNLLGQAVAGELAGERLEPIVHDNTLWFAWAAFKPDTRIYQQR